MTELVLPALMSAGPPGLVATIVFAPLLITVTVRLFVVAPLKPKVPGSVQITLLGLTGACEMQSASAGLAQTNPESAVAEARRARVVIARIRFSPFF